jgi:hypothetical protein
MRRCKSVVVSEECGGYSASRAIFRGQFTTRHTASLPVTGAGGSVEKNCVASRIPTSENGSCRECGVGRASGWANDHHSSRTEGRSVLSGPKKVVRGGIFRLNWPLAWEMLDVATVVLEAGFLVAILSCRLMRVFCVVTCFFVASRFLIQFIKNLRSDSNSPEPLGSATDSRAAQAKKPASRRPI